MKSLRFTPPYISPQDFCDLRHFSDLTRKQAADLLAVSVRTVQNWETGGARVPWMAYRMLRIIRGYDLPGKAWEGWTLRGDTLFSPDGRSFPSGDLYHLANTFAQAKLFRELYARSGRVKNRTGTVLPFPDLRRSDEAGQEARRPRPVAVVQGESPLDADGFAVSPEGAARSRNGVQS